VFAIEESTTEEIRLRVGVRACGNTYFGCRDIPLLSGRSSMAGPNIRHVNGNCWKGFKGQRSKVKVIARRNVIFRQRDSYQLMAVRPLFFRFPDQLTYSDAENVLTVWRQVSLFSSLLL